MARYIATMNTPGYLPQDDGVHVFDTPAEAWSYLATERREAEDNDETEYEDAEGDYSDVVDELDAYESCDHGSGTVHGYTPGYDGTHDLGIAYTVTQVERGLYRCPCCGDDVIGDVGYGCDDCTIEGCEESPDACGEVAYWECQRTDSVSATEAMEADEGEGDAGCTCERIPGSLDYTKCAFCIDLETHCYVCRRVGHPISEECTP
jgi:hypothetical protein